MRSLLASTVAFLLTSTVCPALFLVSAEEPNSLRGTGDERDGMRRKTTSTMTCSGAATSSKYTTSVNVFTSGSKDTGFDGCSSDEASEIEKLIENEFDSIVNNDNHYQGSFVLSTSFCGRRRLESLSGEELEAAEDKILEDLFRDATDLSKESYLKNEKKLEIIEGRRLDDTFVLRFILGDGDCQMCEPDDDDRRRLVDAETYFYSETAGMERILNSQLTKKLHDAYNNKSGHCLKGKHPRAEVHIVVVTSQSAVCADEAMYCCAPYHNLRDVCSKNVFGDSWYCHESQAQCEGPCSGAWVNSVDPPKDCLSKWADCTDADATCCAPYSTCHQQNQWYSQCL